MTRTFVFATDEYYHCYCRGNEKRRTFITEKEYYRFIALLFVCNSKEVIHLSDYNSRPFSEIFNIDKKNTIVDIGAYCLMPNHFHILVREKIEGGISLFMQKVMTGYTMYFNKKHERTGSLFEGSFKAQHVEDDDYLKYLFSYIHLNPIKLIDSNWKENGIKDRKKALNFLNGYEFSSYLDYLNPENARPQSIILNKKAFPEYFSNPEDFKLEIFDWLSIVKVKP